MLTLRALATAAILAGLTAGCTVPGYTFGSGGSGGTDASTDGNGGSGGGTGGAGPDAGCQSDQDCTGSKQRCNTATGQCVQCLPTDDTCPPGRYCEKASYSCQPGCKSSAECNDFDGGTGAATCTNHKCHCTQDGDCPLGQICISTLCIPGCTVQHGCPSPEDCCSSGSGMSCINTSGDLDNCGSCGHVCPAALPNGSESCNVGKCVFSCNTGMADCNKDPSDGCEVNVLTDPKNCGSCGHVCQGSGTCVNKFCTSADAG